MAAIESQLIAQNETFNNKMTTIVSQISEEHKFVRSEINSIRSEIELNKNEMIRKVSEKIQAVEDKLLRESAVVEAKINVANDVIQEKLDRESKKVSLEILTVSESLNTKLQSAYDRLERKISDSDSRVSSNLREIRLECNRRSEKLFASNSANEAEMLMLKKSVQTIQEQFHKKIEYFEEHIDLGKDEVKGLITSITDEMYKMSDVIEIIKDKINTIEGGTIGDINKKLQLLQENAIDFSTEKVILANKIETESEMNSYRIKGLEIEVAKGVKKMETLERVLIPVMQQQQVQKSHTPHTSPPATPPLENFHDKWAGKNVGNDMNNRNPDFRSDVYKTQSFGNNRDVYNKQTFWSNKPEEIQSDIRGDKFRLQGSEPTMHGSNKFFDLFKKENHTFNGENKSLLFLKEAEELKILTGMSEPQFIYYFPHLLYGKARDWWDLSTDPVNSWEEIKERMIGYYGSEYHREMKRSEWYNLEFLHSSDVENFTFRALKLQRELNPFENLNKRLELIILKMPYALRDFLFNREIRSEEEFLYYAKEAMRLKGQSVRFHSGRNCNKTHYPSVIYGTTVNEKYNNINKYRGNDSEDSYDEDVSHNLRSNGNVKNNSQVNKDKGGWKDEGYRGNYKGNKDNGNQKRDDNTKTYHNKNYSNDDRNNRNKTIGGITYWEPGKLEMDGHVFKSSADMVLYQYKTGYRPSTQPTLANTTIPFTQSPATQT